MSADASDLPARPANHASSSAPNAGSAAAAADEQALAQGGLSASDSGHNDSAAGPEAPASRPPRQVVVPGGTDQALCVDSADAAAAADPELRAREVEAGAPGPLEAALPAQASEQLTGLAEGANPREGKASGAPGLELGTQGALEELEEQDVLAGASGGEVGTRAVEVAPSSTDASGEEAPDAGAGARAAEPGEADAVVQQPEGEEASAPAHSPLDVAREPSVVSAPPAPSAPASSLGTVGELERPQGDPWPVPQRGPNRPDGNGVPVSVAVGLAGLLAGCIWVLVH